jgi:hypothetical protein
VALFAIVITILIIKRNNELKQDPTPDKAETIKETANV